MPFSMVKWPGSENCFAAVLTETKVCVSIRVHKVTNVVT